MATVEPAKREKDFVAKALPGDNLPEDFRRFDKPLNLEQHQLTSLFYAVAHVFALYWILYLFPQGKVPRLSLAWWIVYNYFGILGTTVGAHRYWTHRSFKANLPLQILMMIMQTSALQYPIFKWCRDHRVHHKYMDGMADPHSAGRGFWFSHMTWLFQRKHPECEKALQEVEVSDMARDPVIRFQSRYYWSLVILAYFVIPMYIAHLLWPEMTFMGLLAGNFFRWVVSIHITSTVNSVAHAFGMEGRRPYDKAISPIQSEAVSFIAGGEGFHNYHHTFPWDYRTSEFGLYFNLGNVFIHSFASIGWAWDMKIVSQKMLIDRINRTGDGSHPLHDHSIEQKDEGDRSSIACWGWGDETLKEEDVAITKTMFPSRSG